MKKTISAFLALALIGSSMPGCTPRDAVNNPVSVVSAEAKALQEPAYGEQYPAAAQAAAGANDFAFRLSAALVQQNGDANFVCSPYSVWLPLAALANATDAQHKEALVKALGAAGIDTADLNNAASRMLYDLTKQRDKQYSESSGGEYYHNPLSIANAIFVGNNVTLKKDFAQAFTDYYRGSAINVDFHSQEAVAAVNKWASDNTDGLITDIIQEFDPDTVAAIANAIYFSDRWSWEFNPDNTKSDVFHSPGGETNALFMLREGDMLTYYEDDKLQAMPLSFLTGGGMYILLPKDGDAKGLLASMTGTYLDEIRNQSVNATGKLLLPRFSIESGAMLKDALTAMGVPLFDEKAAPLTGGLIEESMPVWLSSALQKAVIKVDEKGTTAAAVTVMMAAGAAMPAPTEPFVMNCNRPFVFVLCGNTYDGGNQVLFTGIVNKPQINL